MSIKIVADSSCDVHALEGVNLSVCPLQIITEKKTYIDNEALNVDVMVNDLKALNSKSSTSCPNVADWTDKFEGASEIFAITISGDLSGSYNAACTAAEVYKNENPDCKISVIDTRSTGPVMTLLIEKIAILIGQNLSFEEIDKEARKYLASLHVLFLLSSVKNLSNNGRVSKLAAKAVGILNLRLLGHDNDGKIELIEKCRGSAKGLSRLVANMKEFGFKEGKVAIHHANNLEGAKQLAAILKQLNEKCNIAIRKCGGLCSFYAEDGGLIVGFERN